MIHALCTDTSGFFPAAAATNGAASRNRPVAGLAEEDVVPFEGMPLESIDVRPVAPERLAPFIGPERAAQFAEIAEKARTVLGSRKIINVNSTAAGGGVAELLQTLLAYGRGAGVDARWLVIEGNTRFFEITKRLHNRLYGVAGDRGPLEQDERRDYEATLAPNREQLLEFVDPGDVLLLHDPQTAGLVPMLRAAGAPIVWRCHVGIDVQNEWSDTGWAFLRPYIEDADAFVFSREQFAPDWVPRERLTVIAPSIDPFSAKNQPIPDGDVVRILRHVGLIDGDPDGATWEFTRRSGERGAITMRADLLGTGPAPPSDAPLVLQASRWDALKDMSGVMLAFADHVPSTDAHLMLAGPEAAGVADDPEANSVLASCLSLWAKLAPEVRSRIHLVSIPMGDGDQAAAVVNALQCHASVVAQKSIAEGFGLTVVEAMWKSRPVVASAVGGIVDQVVDGETGYLLGDPHDLEACGEAFTRLLTDDDLAHSMGRRARERAAREFLPDRHLSQWAALFNRLSDGG